jgi:hypothetical protein
LMVRMINPKSRRVRGARPGGMIVLIAHETSYLSSSCCAPRSRLIASQLGAFVLSRFNHIKACSYSGVRSARFGKSRIFISEFGLPG